MNEVLNMWNQVLKSKGTEIALRVFPENTTYTYEALDADADSLLELIKTEFRVDSSSPVVSFRSNSRYEWLVTFLAIVKGGCIAAPIDSTSTLDEVARIQESLGVNLHFEGSKMQKLSSRIRKKYGRAGVSVFKLTSGSTAFAKAYAFREQEMIADAQNIMATMEIGASDIQYATIPLGHSYGLGSLVYPFFIAGTPLVFNSVPLPSIIEKELALSQATVMPTIPAILKGLAMSENLTLPKTLRTVISAASPLTREVWEAFRAKFALSIHNFYGSSETGGVAYDRTGEICFSTPGAVGESMLGVKLSISPSGRVHVSSKAVYSYGNRRKTAEGASFLMADYGILDGEALVLKGRSNRVVKHNGKRIDLIQIEKLLCEHAQIDQAVILYEEKRHRLVCAIAGSISAAAFTDYAWKCLPSWKRPKKLWIAKAIPTTQRGKVDQIRIYEQLNNSGVVLKYS